MLYDRYKIMSKQKHAVHEAELNKLKKKVAHMLIYNYNKKLKTETSYSKNIK